jgi:hypothetical protein
MRVTEPHTVEYTKKTPAGVDMSAVIDDARRRGRIGKCVSLEKRQLII